jgi:DNA-binding GntR family transcriptional regulator
MRLSDRAYQLIRHRILVLDLPPNAPIDETALMDALELGRTPIREALQRLAAEGLVRVAPRRGMFVSDIGITELQKLFELRLVLEAFCADLSARRATREQLDEMDALITELRLVPDDDAKGLMAIDEQFHELLFQAAHNELLADTLRRLHAHSLRIWHLLLGRLGSVRPAMEQHAAILDAVKAGEGQAAAELMQEHISEFQAQIKAAL